MILINNIMPTIYMASCGDGVYWLARNGEIGNGKWEMEMVYVEILFLTEEKQLESVDEVASDCSIRIIQRIKFVN